MIFKIFLQKAQGQFEKFKKIGKNFVKARKTYTNELGNITVSSFSIQI